MSERALELIRQLKHMAGKHPQKSHGRRSGFMYSGNPIEAAQRAGASGFTAERGHEEREQYMRDYAHEIGYAGTAAEVSDLSRTGGPTIVRYASAAYGLESLQGDVYLANGNSGSGIYFGGPNASNKTVVNSTELKISAKLTSDAKVADLGALRRSMQADNDAVDAEQRKAIEKYAGELYDGNTSALISNIESHPAILSELNARDSMLNGPLRDEGWYAMTQGYDAVHNKGMDYYVVVNRAKLNYTYEDRRD